jgi:glycosyltransferase involved in cell wall biosynthesis
LIRALRIVLRGEGAMSAGTRAAERSAEALRRAAMRARAAWSLPVATTVLNVSTFDVTERSGGVQVQLLARLREEKKLRRVALLRPGALDTWEPSGASRPMPRHEATRDFHSQRFEDAVRAALRVTGASSIHLEGTSGVPVASVLRLIAQGVKVITSVHDFSLFCARPHLLEQPEEAFCAYSEDFARCLKCLRQSWPVESDEQPERRRLGRELLQASHALIFPSQFLLDRHRELFALPDLEALVIEPSTAATNGPAAAAGPAIAFAGNVQRHKGAHLLPHLIEAVRAPWHIFGGGDPELLRAIRKCGATVHGYYRSATLPALLRRHHVGLVVLPSIVPESFSLVLSDAWRSGAAALAFDLGAPAERIRAQGGGRLATLESGVDGLVREILEWQREGAMAVPMPGSAAEAARAHLELYARI